MVTRWTTHSAWTLLAGLLLPQALLFAQQTQPSVPAGKPAPSALYQRLQAEAERALAKRRSDFEQLKTAEQIKAWQQRRRQLFLRALGDLPDGKDWPLHVQTVGTLTGAGFRVEKVIFDSRPNHRITGNLYLPITAPPFPAVIVPCGHSFTGKAADGYQRVSMLLARNGIAALCYDPIGQGERYQTMGSDGRPLGADYTGAPNSVRQLVEIPGQPHFNPVEEHTLIGMGAILVGSNAATFRIHDGMRAIDYLVSRSDIDKRRIGCTGNSGGGTLTAYLMALDDRITCAAPTCYLTTFHHLLQSAGPQDAEQNLFGQIRDGLDEADYVLMRAPTPIALCAGTRDATFDIAGTWDIFREAKRVYARLGYPERVDLVEADEPHGFTQPLRVGAARWMRRWLLQTDDAVTEPDLPLFSLADLQCTPHGQVRQLPGERSVFELLASRAAEFASARKSRWSDQPREQALQQVRELAGVRPLADIPPMKLARPKDATRFVFATYQQEEWLLETDTGVQLPATALVPRQPSGKRVLVLHHAGRAAALADADTAARLAAGDMILTVDLSGIGDTAMRHPRDWGGTLFAANTQEFFLAYLLGKSLVGIRTEEILSAVRVLREYGNEDAREVSVLAIGSSTGIPALHAAALAPALCGPLTTSETLGSWLEILTDPTRGPELQNLVPGALTVYDLPDLRAGAK